MGVTSHAQLYRRRRAAYLTPWSYLFPPPPPPQRCVHELKSPWKTENDWLAGEVLRDLGEMIAFAQDPQLYAQDAPQVGLAPVEGPDGVPTLDVTLAFGALRAQSRFAARHFIWSPEDHAAVATVFLQQAGLTAAPASHDDKLLEELSDLRPATLVAADQAVSARLAQQMLDAGAHEDAALVLGAFAWREAAGAFTDVRALLSRSAAHLALARALRAGDEPSTNGRVAEAVLLQLAGRGADAARTLEPLSESPAAAARWARALYVLRTDDWRAKPGTSLIERLAHYRATARARSEGYALELLDEDEGDGPGVTDWGRQILQGSFSVQVGWRFAVDGVDREWAELQDVRQRLGLDALNDESRTAALNAPQERCVTKAGPRVLGWPAWAASFQRHASFFALAADKQLRGKVGMPDEADQLRWKLDAILAGSTLRPLTDLRRAAARAGKKKTPVVKELVAESTVALLVARPEVLTVTSWRDVEKATGRMTKCSAPAASTWFGDGFPFGTAYRYGRRADTLKPSAQVYARKRELAPDDYHMLHWRLGVEPALSMTPAGLVTAFGERADYDTRVVWRAAWAAQDDVADSLVWLEKLCALDVDHCGWLGAVLVERGDDDQAATAYQRLMDHGRDRVAAANRSAFLVRHYETHGKAKRAEAVAFMAGQVGSADGLATLGRLLERRKRLREAEQVFESIHDRYPDSEHSYNDLLGFYYRTDVVRKDDGFVGRFREAAAKVFPDGLEPVRLDELSAPPTDGVRIVRAGRAASRAGLRSNDVIVALDGWRLRSLRQLGVAMTFDDAPDLVLFVWRDGAYVEFKLRLASRHLGSRLATYTVSQAAAPVP